MPATYSTTATANPAQTLIRSATYAEQIAHILAGVAQSCGATIAACKIVRALLQHANRAHNYTWCSMARMAEVVGVSITTAERAIKWLKRHFGLRVVEDGDEIATIPNRRPSRKWQVNVYDLSPWIQWIPAALLNSDDGPTGTELQNAEDWREKQGRLFPDPFEGDAERIDDGKLSTAPGSSLCINTQNEAQPREFQPPKMTGLNSKMPPGVAALRAVGVFPAVARKMVEKWGELGAVEWIGAAKQSGARQIAAWLCGAWKADAVMSDAQERRGDRERRVHLRQNRPTEILDKPLGSISHKSEYKTQTDLACLTQYHHGQNPDDLMRRANNLLLSGQIDDAEFYRLKAQAAALDAEYFAANANAHAGAYADEIH